jgi:uncharacterized protein (TIGR02001 family)
MKKLSYLLILSGLVSVSAIAADSPHSVTGNLYLVSDYQFRGVSQTDEDPAIQGGFDYAHASGFYLGVWASNVEFGAANSEWDVYGGYAGSAGDLGYNVGVLQYLYPGYSDANTTELYAGVTFKQFGLKASYTISDDYFDIGDGDGTVYWDATANFEVGAGLTLGLHYGYTDGSGNQVDYADWKIGVTKEIGGFNVGLAYTDTDEAGFGRFGDERIILSIGKSF